jgi:uncharacterized Zn-finger protein
MKNMKLNKNFLCMFFLFNHNSIFSVKILNSNIQKEYFSCTNCTKNFIDKNGLKRHMLTHIEKKPFSCVQCNKGFSVKYNFDRHMLIHTNKNLFFCIQCNKKFLKKYCLEQHELTHTKEKPFACIECDKRFLKKYNLEQHELIHTRKKTFSNLEQQQYKKYCIKNNIYSQFNTNNNYPLLYIPKPTAILFRTILPQIPSQTYMPNGYNQTTVFPTQKNPQYTIPLEPLFDIEI